MTDDEALSALLAQGFSPETAARAVHESTIAAHPVQVGYRDRTGGLTSDESPTDLPRGNPEGPESRGTGFLGQVRYGVKHPIEEAKAEAKAIPGAVGGFGTKLADTLSVGAYSKARDLAVGAISPSAAQAARDSDQQFYREQPFATGAAEGLGYVLPVGAPAAIGRSANAVVGGLAPRLAASAAGRIGTGAAVGALSSGAQSAAQGVADGQSAGDVAKNAGKAAAIGAGVGTAGASVGELLGAAGRAALNSKGAQARRLIEGYGGKVGVTDSGSGLPEFQGVDTVTDADIGAQARKSAGELVKANDARFDAEGRQPYRAARAAIDPAAGQNLVDATPLRNKMLDVAHDPSTDPGTRNWLLSQAAELDKFMDARSRVKVTEEFLNGKTAMLWESAKPGLPSGAGSVRDAKVGAVAATGQALRELGPYADTNAAFSKAKAESGDFRRGLGLNAKPSTNEEVDIAKAANFLSRKGQTTTTAGIRGTNERLDSLVAQNPQLQRTVDAPDLLRAKADLQFGAGDNVGGLITRGMHRGPVSNVLHVAAHNIPAALGRMPQGPAQLAASAPQQVPAMNAFVAAAQAKRQHDAAVIQGIFSKPKPAQQSQDQP